jgi:hypothetical protein
MGKLEHPQGLDADAAETNQEHNAPNSTSLSGGIMRDMYTLCAILI